MKTLTPKELYEQIQSMNRQEAIQLIKITKAIWEHETLVNSLEDLRDIL